MATRARQGSIRRSSIVRASAWAALLAAVALVAVACEPAPETCSRTADCPSGNQCVDGACVRTSRPGDAARDGDAAATPADTGVPPVDVTSPDAGDPDASCRAIEAMARVTRRPVDIVLMVDTSASTGGSPARVREEVNAQLARILVDAMVDYRVILLASGLTIGEPLASSGRFFSAPFGLGSGDDAAFKPVLDGYASWRGFLRPGVKKVIMHFTDSVGDGERIVGYASTFDAELYRIDPANFGASAADGLLTYHAVIGLQQRAAMPTQPWQPAEPLVSGVCSSPEFRATPGAGPGFQRVAMRTGGLRFPICLFPSFDVLFRAVADSVVEYAAPACEFELPTPPAGSSLDLSTVVVRYRSGASSTLFRQVASAAACTPSSFYIASGRITLCPAACATVRADRAARVSIAFGCANIPG